MPSHRSEYKQHTIEVRTRTDRSAAVPGSAPPPGGAGHDVEELLIDGQPVAFGRLVDGSYVLEDYAYDYTDDVEELARRYLDHRERAERARDASRPGRAEES